MSPEPEVNETPSVKDVQKMRSIKHHIIGDPIVEEKHRTLRPNQCIFLNTPVGRTPRNDGSAYMKCKIMSIRKERSSAKVWFLCQPYYDYEDLRNMKLTRKSMDLLESLGQWELVRGTETLVISPDEVVDVAYIPEYDDGIGAPTCVEFDLNGGAQEPVPLILDRGQWFYRCHLSSTSGGKLEIKGLKNHCICMTVYSPTDDQHFFCPKCSKWSDVSCAERKTPSEALDIPSSIADWPKMVPAVRGKWWVDADVDDEDDGQGVLPDVQSAWMTVGSVGIHNDIREVLEELEAEEHSPEPAEREELLHQAATEEYQVGLDKLALKKFICPRCNKPVC